MEIDRNPTGTKLRSFGLLAAGLCSIAGVSSRQPLWFAIAILLGGLALARPAVLKVVYVGLSLATYPIGWVLSRVLLLLVYCVLIVPTGLVMRALGRDPMKRKFDRQATTYWETRVSQRPPESYLRRF